MRRETMIRLTAPALAALAVPATPLLLAAQEAEGESLFSVNLGLSAWTVVIFLVLLWVLKRFAWGPILDAVEARERAIREALEEASRRQEEAEKLAARQREQLAEARRTAREIVAEGREAGEQVRRDIEKKARDESQRMVERARREIDREKKAAVDTVRREAVDLALAAASKLLDQKLDEERDREVVRDYLDDLAAGETEVPA